MEKINTSLTPRRRYLILFNVSISVLMATLDASIVNIALTTISNKFAADISSVQWIVTSYLLTISVTLLLWGKISDLIGKKKIFAVGFFLFTVGSLLCGLSTNLSMLVFSRIIQAFGASAMMSLSQGIITATFPANERGKALGINGSMVAIGQLLGPSIGGFLIHAINWQTIFYINIPIGITGFLLTLTIIPELHEPQQFKSFDYKGTFLFTASILLLFVSLLFFQENIIPLKFFIPMLAVALILLAVFIFHERNASCPLIDLRLFQKKMFSFGIASGFLSFVSIFTVVLFVPFYLQSVLKMNSLHAGLLYAANPLTSMFVAPISGWLSDKLSYKLLTISGLLLTAVSLFCMSLLTPSSSLLIIGILLAMMGAGIALFQSPNTSSVMGAVDRTQLGLAGGLQALARNLGMATGSAISLVIFMSITHMNLGNQAVKIMNSSAFSSAFMKGFHAVLIFGGCVSLSAAFVGLSREGRISQK